ncbi:tetratricopeptide repeat protein [Novosphingobium sp. PC22D]|uniref:tetratricopeptide repeat protein n=1 Tax=Novosphingobium sp. PC22D TaxID=1962403 RepID=UPI001F0B284F|nr:tetratricopeptide repeat protein [Novosphingobium sp. PC22D]
MALPPSDKNAPADKAAQRKAAQDDVFMREVDDALRQDQFEGFFKRFGIPVILVVVLGLGGFGGYLWWSNHQKSVRDGNAETFIQALDDVDASNFDAANDKLAALGQDAEGGSAASAKLMRAGIALKQGRKDEAIGLYKEISGDASVPQPLRDLATVREVAAAYDTMKPQEIVDRLKPLAQPGNPWFGVAGEMTGFAYLQLDKRDLAGPLFAKIARDESQPDSLRSRTRQIAGVLGVDAIEDVIENRPGGDGSGGVGQESIAGAPIAAQ